MKLIIGIIAFIVICFYTFNSGDNTFAEQRAARGEIDTAMLAKCGLPTYEPVIVFTTTWCSSCKQMKSILSQKGISYHEIDAEKTSAGRSGFRCSGGTGYPHLIVEGRQVDITNGNELHNALDPYSS